MAKKENSITYKSKIYKLEHLVGMHYFEVPIDIIAKFGGKFKIRLLCTINDKLTFQGGVVALGNGNGYISINTARLKKLGLKFKATPSPPPIRSSVVGAPPIIIAARNCFTKCRAESWPTGHWSLRC